MTRFFIIIFIQDGMLINKKTRQEIENKRTT